MKSKEQETEENRYQATWRFIRMCEFCFVPVWMLAAVLAIIELRSPGTIPGTRVILFAMVAGSVLVAMLIQPNCPRCGEKFFRLGLARDGTSKSKCVHCGLPRGAVPDPEQHSELSSRPEDNAVSESSLDVVNNSDTTK